MTTNTKHNPALMVSDAFKLVEAGEKSVKTGRQTLAAAIMFRHADQIAQGVVLPTFAALDRDLKSGARKDYLERLMEFAGLPARESEENAKGDSATQHNAKRNARYQMLSRGLQLAVDLTANGVGTKNWHDATRFFRVPASALKMPGDVASGALAKDDKMVPLDGQSYRVVRGDKVARIIASVQQLGDVAKARAGKPTGKAAHKRDEESTANAAPLAEVFAAANARLNECTLYMALEQAGLALNHAAEIVSERGLEPTPWAELPEATRRAIEAVEIFAAECRAASK